MLSYKTSVIVRTGLSWVIRPLARVIGWPRVSIRPTTGSNEAVLAEIGRIISSSLDISQVYDEFSRELIRLVPFDRVSIALVDPTSETVSSTFFQGTDVPESRPGQTIPLAGSFTEAITIKNFGLIIQSLSETALAGQFPGLLFGYKQGLRSFLGVPLLSKGKAIGAIVLSSANPNCYCDRHLKVAERVAHQIGPALENARLYKELQESVGEMAAVDEVARIMTSTLDVEEVYEQFAGAIKTLIDFDGVTINFIDHESKTVEVAYIAMSGPKSFTVGQTFPLENSATGFVSNSRSTLIYEINEHPEFSTSKRNLADGFKNLIALPRISTDRVIGILAVFSNQNNSFGPREQVILERLASQIAPALENAQLFREVQQQSLALASIGESVNFVDLAGC